MYDSRKVCHSRHHSFSTRPNDLNISCVRVAVAVAYTQRNIQHMLLRTAAPHKLSATESTCRASSHLASLRSFVRDVNADQHITRTTLAQSNALSRLPFFQSCPVVNCTQTLRHTAQVRATRRQHFGSLVVRAQFADSSLANDDASAHNPWAS